MWYWILDLVLVFFLFVFMIDGLTHLWVRRVYDLVYHLTRKKLVILFDLDGFKTINDQYGHHVGDKVLREVGRILLIESRFRAFRYGGDEFAILLPSLNKERAEKLAERVKRRIESDKLITKYGITISYGIGGTEQEADKRLYEEKGGKS